jgi:cytochrome c oxidase subunit 2
MSVRSDTGAPCSGLKGLTLLCGLLGWLPPAAAVTLDLRAGVTEISHRVQNLHHISLGVCVVMGVIVFGAMTYSIFAHRRSRHPTPSRAHENTRLEVFWTVIPTLILIGMAIPATSTLIDIEDNSDADLSVLITGSQWKWHYRYLDSDVAFYSNTTTPKEQIDNLQPKTELYLRTVDNPLVLPTNKKVRFLTTSGDVIHSWWVPDIAVKQDAVPGFINEAWARVETPGVYRGQCAELCGKDHAFMPIVIEVKPEKEFDTWMTEKKQALALASEAAVAARGRTWAMAELLPLGEGVYLKHCATCHQPNGSGQSGKYPALNGSQIVNGPIKDHLNRVMNGKADTEMQAWAPQLSDLDIAAVITFERNSWNNKTGDVIQPLLVYSSR